MLYFQYPFVKIKISYLDVCINSNPCKYIFILLLETFNELINLISKCLQFYFSERKIVAFKLIGFLVSWI